MDICTIIARNYLAYARVLSRSFLTHNARSKAYVLILDDEDGLIGGDEDFTVMRPADLDISRHEFHSMAMIYDVMELATAVKPWLLRALLDQGLPQIAYLDPDIKVYSTLDDLGPLSQEHGLALTPHVLQPIPRDGKRPSEADILSSGTYNLGFVAVSQASRPFLSWWEERLSRDCRRDVANGIFVDQRWIDLAVHYFDHHSIRDSAFNVAYWNLDQRLLDRTSAGYTVDGRPLRFFHFSGFEPRRPGVMSKHMRDAPRQAIKEGPILEIFNEYARDLLACEHMAWAGCPYGFSRTASGLPISGTMRNRYRQDLISAGGGPTLPDPFALEDAAAWFRLARRWNSQLVGDWVRESYGILRSRTRSALELGLSIGEERLAAPVQPRRLPPLPAQQESRTGKGLPRGVNVVGNLRAESGVGELGRRAVHALRAARIPYNLFVNPITSSRQTATVIADDSREVFDQNLVCANADQLPILAGLLGRTLLRGRYNIGYWAWELGVFPVQMAASEAFVDEIWALSDHAANAIRGAVSKKTVRCFPPPIPTPHVLEAQLDLGLPQGYLFLFCFDFLSVFDRKNPIAVVDAFRRAFPTPCGVTLLLKSVNGHLRPEELIRLRRHASDRPDVVIRDQSLSASDQAKLMATCDAYVSLHRAEGFGFTMAEAMALGKPVIATGYSGNLEFMTSENSFLVPYTLTTVGAGSDPYPEAAKWAAPDIDAAARMMRGLLEDPVEADLRGRRGAQDIAERHSAEARARLLAELLSGKSPVVDSSGSALRVRLSAFDGAAARLTLSAGGKAWSLQRKYPRARSTLQRRAARSRRRLRTVETQIEELSRAVISLTTQLRAVPYTAPGHGLVLGEGDDAFIGYRYSDVTSGRSYSAFEDTFRGSEEFIRERQRVYLQLLLAHQPVADLGCGRGEMLELLAAEGAEVTGVDADLDMVKRARAKGLAVVQGDALSWLDGCNDMALGSIFSAQFIEHLPYGELLQLLERCRAKLRPGGLLIAETVNPHALHAWKTFWVDLSHVKPIFPEVLVLLCREAGFGAARVMFPNGTGELATDRWAEGEYAVLAWAPDEST